MQRALLQFKSPRNFELVREALRLCGRDDLIGYGAKALVPPREGRREAGAVHSQASRFQHGVRQKAAEKWAGAGAKRNGSAGGSSQNSLGSQSGSRASRGKRR